MFWKILLRVTHKSKCKRNDKKVRLRNLSMTMFKSDVQSVRLFRGYSYADAVATGRLLCQWYADKSGAIRQSVALSDGRRHGSGNLAHQATEGSKGPVFPGNSVIILLAPYPFSTLRIFIKILSSFDNILFINTVTSRMTQALCAAAQQETSK